MAKGKPPFPPKGGKAPPFGKSGPAPGGKLPFGKKGGK